MKKKTSLKLQLNRTTILNLVSAEDLNKIQGGHSEYPCTQSCEVACQIEQLTGRWCA